MSAPDYYMGIGPWQRDTEPNWTVEPPFGRGSQPADLIPAGVWPEAAA